MPITCSRPTRYNTHLPPSMIYFGTTSSHVSAPGSGSRLAFQQLPVSEAARLRMQVKKWEAENQMLARQVFKLEKESSFNAGRLDELFVRLPEAKSVWEELLKPSWKPTPITPSWAIDDSPPPAATPVEPPVVDSVETRAVHPAVHATRPPVVHPATTPSRPMTRSRAKAEAQKIAPRRSARQAKMYKR